MKLKHSSVIGVGGIRHLNLELNLQIDIICGPNGKVKSSILLVVSLPFMLVEPKKIIRKDKLKLNYVRIFFKVKEVKMVLFHDEVGCCNSTQKVTHTLEN